MSMKIERTTFLDSLNFFQMRLSALPKAFGFENIVKKGCFPHLFAKATNMHYKGRIPHSKYYSPNTMSPEDRKEFKTWHKRMRHERIKFDFQSELVEYCKNDVEILRRSCLQFRELILQVGSVDPFLECATIASTSMRVYRKNFLRRSTIGLLPPRGYRLANNQSRKAIEWLLWKAHQLNVNIVHAANNREYRIPENLFVDGYYEDENGIKHVLQFHGCFWHGCPRCFCINRDRKLKGEFSLEDRLTKTKITTQKLKDFGYNVTEMWECDFNQEKKNNIQMQNFLRNQQEILLSEPLNPRDAFFGGRTEALVKLCEFTPGSKKKIRYVDVCSLYPYICKYGKYPVGHPTLYIGDECINLVGQNNSLDKVEGLVKCTVLPPQNLHHPVLPVKCNGRLIFSLCRTCTESCHQGFCPHKLASEREISGTWVSDELKKAVEMGYKVTKFFEIWQYRTIKLDTKTGEKGLFQDFINTFLKIKQEADGWPDNCETEEEKQNYIRDFERVEGILLEYDKIAYNPGLRLMAKLLLNSLWGKFGQRENLPKTEVVKSRSRFMTLLTCPEIEVTGIIPINNDCIYVNYIESERSIEHCHQSNAVIAAYTTAQARLKLYKYMEDLGLRVLYCDTDSCIYISTDDPNESNPPLGRYLGDLTNELKKYGKNSYIKKFVSGGPKVYAFIVKKDNGKSVEVCKMKGITLNYKNKKSINYKWMRSYVTEENPVPVILKYKAIRQTATRDIVTRDEQKSCKAVFAKRWFATPSRSYPFGYKL